MIPTDNENDNRTNQKKDKTKSGKKNPKVLVKERSGAFASPNPGETSSGSVQEGREFTAAVVNLSKLSVLSLQKRDMSEGRGGERGEEGYGSSVGRGMKAKSEGNRKK